MEQRTKITTQLTEAYQEAKKGGEHKTIPDWLLWLRDTIKDIMKYIAANPKKKGL